MQRTESISAAPEIVGNDLRNTIAVQDIWKKNREILFKYILYKEK